MHWVFLINYTFFWLLINAIWTTKENLFEQMYEINFEYKKKLINKNLSNFVTE